MNQQEFNKEPKHSRRTVLGLAAAGAFSMIGCKRQVDEVAPKTTVAKVANPDSVAASIDVGPYFTPQTNFVEVTRTRPYLLSQEQLAEAELTRDTWKLDVDVDPEQPAKIGNPMTRESNTSFNFDVLMDLAKSKSVKFIKALTCLNNSKILGTGLWEGVPLRDVLWMTDPKRNLRRVIYHGYHDNDPRKIFRSSLPVGRVLEDAFGLPPVILCYKLNGEWLSVKRGGPVRMVVPEAYGFKAVKWLSHVFLSNAPFANDSYAKANNDIDTNVKSFARFYKLPKTVKANTPFLIKGYAQVGVAGIAKIQVWSHNNADGELPLKGRFVDAPWQDGLILPASNQWANEIKDGKMPLDVIGLNDKTNRPEKWPMRLSKVNWTYEHPGLVKGLHLLRCRTIDDNGNAQPMPRPFEKSGHAKIELQLLKAV